MRALIVDRMSRPLGAQPPATAGLRKAAVLVPLLDRPSGMTVLLLQRTQHLTHHAGQVSLPGGGIEDIDAGPLATALRETEEEIGVARTAIKVVGELESIATTVTGFYITPFVGFIPSDATLSLDAYEVEHAFEMPLEVAVSRRNYERRVRRVEGEDVYFYVLDYEGHAIWGATAQILVNFGRRLGIDASA